jgi:eukaryotic-like serine/threonine-protein kinase
VKVPDDPAVYVASLDGSGARKILDDASSVAYAAGRLLYTRAASLFSSPFELEGLVLSGTEARVVASGVETFSVSDQGTVVYRPEGLSRRELTWFDRNGRRTGTIGERGPYTQVVLSPSGRRAAVVRSGAGEGDIWQIDLATGIFSRLTMDPAIESDPAWSPDERWLAFSSTQPGRQSVFLKDLVSGKDDLLVAMDEPVVVDGWTPDGRHVIVRTLGKAVYTVAVTGDRTPRLLVDTPYVEDELRVSPDGRWVAFNTDESGRWEVYVAAFPAFTSKRQVSSGGGVEPQWRADGRELFYLASDGAIMSVSLGMRGEFAPSPPARLFPTKLAPDPFLAQYAVTDDGQRFLGLEPVGAAASFMFLFNWLNQARSNGSDGAR